MHALLPRAPARVAVDRDGVIEGYASLFGTIDSARDMVMPGAFADTLNRRGLRRIPMLFQHDPSEPIGIWIELREDFRGLFARGRLIPDVQRAREVLALLREGAIDGLSIGFRAVQARVDPQTRVRRLLAVDLWEISIVTFPLLANARVSAVKRAETPGTGAASSRASGGLPRSAWRVSRARITAERAWATVAGNARSTRHW